MTPASNAHEDLSETDFIFKFNKDLLKFSIVVNTATNQMHAAASGYILCKSVNLSTIPHLYTSPPSLAAFCRKTICVELHPWLKMSWAAIRIFATPIS